MTENIIEEKYDIPVDNNKVRLKVLNEYYKYGS